MMKGEINHYRSLSNLNYQSSYTTKTQPIPKQISTLTTGQVNSPKYSPLLQMNPPKSNPTPLIISQQSIGFHVNNPEFVPSSHFPNNEKQFQSIINKYEAKIKHMEKQYKSYRTQYEKKLSQMKRERMHWQNIAIRLGIPNEGIDISQHVNKQYKQKFEQQKICLNREKQELIKQLKNLTNENIRLKNRIGELNFADHSKIVNNNILISHQRSPHNLNQQQNTDQMSGYNPKPQQLIQNRRQSNINIVCEKMHKLITQMNQQIINKGLRELNQRYSHKIQPYY